MTIKAGGVAADDDDDDRITMTTTMTMTMTMTTRAADAKQASTERGGAMGGGGKREGAWRIITSRKRRC